MFLVLRMFCQRYTQNAHPGCLYILPRLRDCSPLPNDKKGKDKLYIVDFTGPNTLANMGYSGHG